MRRCTNLAHTQHRVQSTSSPDCMHGNTAWPLAQSPGWVHYACLCHRAERTLEQPANTLACLRSAMPAARDMHAPPVRYPQAPARPAHRCQVTQMKLHAQAAAQEQEPATPSTQLLQQTASLHSLCWVSNPQALTNSTIHWCTIRSQLSLLPQRQQ